MGGLIPPSSSWSAAIALIAAAVGLLVLGLYLARGQKRDVSLAAFGTAAFLYGARLLIEVRLDQYLDSPPPRFLFFLTAFLSYLVVIPVAGFIVHLFGKGRGNSMLWSFRGAIVFAGVGILSDLVQDKDLSLTPLNNVLVVVWAGVVMINAILPGPKKTRELKIVLAGFLVFGVFALNANLVELNVLPWEWSQEEIGFFIFLVALGVVAVHRFFGNEARLKGLEHELEIARRIQASILPRVLPAVPGMEMAARYVPMAAVAGDFYEVLAQDERRLCVLVADVSGHGLGAALLASMLKIAFASQKPDFAAPGRVLAGMNRALHGKMENNFVTAVCAFIDLEAGILRSASAGHPPALLCRGNAPDILEIGDNGPLLGPFPEAVYPETATALQAGDRVILYTDGILEARNAAGSFFGEAEYRRFIRDRRSLAPGPFADALLDRLSAWSGKGPRGVQDDDLTVVILDKT
jgi:sigma-B regulation protein RsbU (phosphoserine phosphatase)